jgi:hypothetical protein
MTPAPRRARPRPTGAGCAVRRRAVIALSCAVGAGVVAIALILLLKPSIACGRYCEVWSKNGPDGPSYEFKVNDCCSGYDTIGKRPGCGTLQSGFLWECDSVSVVDPGGREFQLAKDFNINTYSGEVTRRWVLYGPAGAGLPKTGRYTFRFYRNRRLVGQNLVRYDQDTIGYPTDVRCRRDGGSLEVTWNPPRGDAAGTWYKVIVYGVSDPSFFSRQFDNSRGTLASATLTDVPMREGNSYDVNVAIYYAHGYAYSEMYRMAWPGPLP